MLLNKMRILALIAEKRMTQSELALRCGISRQSVNTIIRRGTCELRTAGKLADGLGIAVEEIIREGA